MTRKKEKEQKLKKLGAKHLVFCAEYIVSLDATAAAIAAGFSEKAASQIGYRFMQDPLIKAEIEKLKAERIERTKIDADYVLKRLVEIDQLDVMDILNNDGTVKYIQDWPKAWRQFANGIDVQEQFNDGNPTGFLKKIKWPDKVKNLELLGKHVSVQAFNEKLEIKNADAAEELTDDELNREIERRLKALS